MTGAIKGTSSARLYKELVWESLSSRRKLHIPSQFNKIVKNLASYYLSELPQKLSIERTHYRLRSRKNFTQFSCRTSRFQKSFFSSIVHGGISAVFQKCFQHYFQSWFFAMLSHVFYRCCYFDKQNNFFILCFKIQC